MHEHKQPNYKLRRTVAASILAPMALATTYGGGKAVDKISGLSEAQAALSSKDAKPFTHNSGVKTIPYEVGDSVGEQMVSEIASDLHAVAPNQEYTEAIHAIQSYLPPEDQKNYIVHAGQDFNFLVDIENGKILPNPNETSGSGE